MTILHKWINTYSCLFHYLLERDPRETRICCTALPQTPDARRDVANCVAVLPSLECCRWKTYLSEEKCKKNMSFKDWATWSNFHAHIRSCLSEPEGKDVALSTRVSCHKLVDGWAEGLLSTLHPPPCPRSPCSKGFPQPWQQYFAYPSHPNQTVPCLQISGNPFMVTLLFKFVTFLGNRTYSFSQ